MRACVGVYIEKVEFSSFFFLCGMFIYDVRFSVSDVANLWGRARGRGFNGNRIVAFDPGGLLLLSLGFAFLFVRLKGMSASAIVVGGSICDSSRRLFWIYFRDNDELLWLLASNLRVVG